MRPLDGINVVSLEQAVAAPFATRQLADLGATVIKIERPGDGDFARHYDHTVNGLSSHFVWLNRSKKSLTLNVKHPMARDILARLMRDADVFVQNLAPGAAQRLGLDSEMIINQYPRLIVCNISGYGRDGPYQNKKAYDLLVQCETGLTSTTGDGESMAKVGISAADIAAGMYACSGVLTALYRRERTGTGTVLDVSLFDALGEWMGYPAYYTAYGGAPPPRTGLSHATIAPYGPYRSGDDQRVMLAIQNEREWRVFCERVLERPELAADSRFSSNARRVAHRRDLDAAIGELFQTLTAVDIVRRLDRAQVANARINDMQAFWDHPQLHERGRWRDIDSPAGPLKALLPPVMMRDAEVQMGPVPALGEHSDAILHALGYDTADIKRLRHDGAI